ncbi:MAG TPA: DHA2 family efflux MFS transporter permease subunit, partial [Bryobacteraceae bacterium]|nr:DHA2 family efflux MFS transporter permease subunit [Bryobacteraceae bacterium]
MLIIFRILQGATGGALQPLSQAVMLEAFPPQDRGKAMGFWGLGIVVAPMLGPVLGGWLTDNFSWRWVFYINVPVGILCIVMVKAFIFDPPYIRKARVGIDYWGISMLTVGIAALQVVLDKGQQEDWFASHLISWLSVIALGSLAAFVIRELRATNPVVQLRVFKTRTYATGVVLMTVVGFVLYGSMVLLPLFLQSLLGYPALEAGIAMAPRGLGSFIAMPVVGLMLSRFDPRKLLALGMIGASYTLYDLSTLNLHAGYWDVFWPQFFQGLSLALLFVPLTTTTMDPIPKQETGNATSLFNLMRNLGGSMGIATATTLLARQQQIGSNRLAAHTNEFNPQFSSMLEGLRPGMMARGADFATATKQAYAAIYGMVQRQAAMLSFVHVFQLFAIIFIAALPLLLLMNRPKRTQAIAAH